MDIEKMLKGEEPVPQNLLEKEKFTEEEYKKKLEEINKQETELMEEIKREKESNPYLDESSPEMKEYEKKIEEFVKKRIEIENRKPLSLIEKEKEIEVTISGCK